MVRPLALVLVVGAFLIVSMRADLQLSPVVDEYEMEGIKLKQLAFSDGNKKVTYQSPRGWNYSGSANQLTLHPPNKAQAEATITRVSLPEEGRFDDEGLKTLVAEASAALPKGSENITILSQEKNPVMIGRKETFLVILSYNLFGQSYSRSVLFLNRGKEQIQFQLVCRDSDFKELQKAFFASQFSWQNL